LLVEAAHGVVNSFDDIYFLLVGDGPMLGAVKRRIESLNLTTRFICTGHRDDSVDCINAMDVIVLTSSEVEGCSNSLLEAMQLGKAVVATRVGGTIELIKHDQNGLLISPKKPDDLELSILVLYENPELRKRLGERARMSVQQRFSQSTMVQKHERLFEMMLERNGKQRKTTVKHIDQNRKSFARSMILDCPVDRITLAQCVSYFKQVLREGRHCHIVMVNAAKLVKARRDRELKEVIENADLVGADGVPIVWASRLLGQPLPGRVNGTDLMHELFIASARYGWRLYLLGAKPEIIQNVVDNIRRQLPTINIVGYRHGYFESPDEELKVIEQINAAKPDILMLGFSTPMKEKWVRRHKDRLNAPIIHGVGGSFDIVGGLTKRAPLWMQSSGLEWLFRLVQEPGRMWRRYLSTNTVFMWLVLRSWFLRLSHTSRSPSE